MRRGRGGRAGGFALAAGSVVVGAPYEDEVATASSAAADAGTAARSAFEVCGGSAFVVVFPIPGAAEPLLVGISSTYCSTADDFGLGGGPAAGAAGAAATVARETNRALSRLFAGVVGLTAESVP